MARESARAEVKPEPPKADREVTHLDQGWSDAERQAFYRLYEGSQLIPYPWFLALEQANGSEAFRSDENIERFRYLPGKLDAVVNPDKLPVGFTKERDARGGDWLGFNCAACHTSQVDYRGRSIRIDGGPALADFSAFSTALLEALEATLRDPAKFERFAAVVLGSGPGEIAAMGLRREVVDFTRDFKSYIERNKGTAPGFGRLDALGYSLNESLGTALKIPANLSPPNAPVSYPSVWLTPRLEWVQWNGAVNNPLSRNVGQALSVFGHVSLTGPVRDRFASTVVVRNLYLLEQKLDQLKPPAWPEAVLGPIDQAKAKRGAEIYQRLRCADCHADRPPYPMTAPNEFGKQFIKVWTRALAETGTDPLAAENFLKDAQPGVLATNFVGVPTVKKAQVFGLIASMTGERQLDDLHLTDDEKVMYRGYRGRASKTLAEMLAYKAGPLAGIWATAPYLHNGSVPNLYQLLLPSKDRKPFRVGSREIDPNHVGFEDAGGFEFRVDVPGNSNAGHENREAYPGTDYGTDLNDDERWSLVEYLKTL